MNIKKIAFAPLFLMSFAYLCFQMSLLKNPLDSVFSLSLSSYMPVVLLSALILFSSLLFVVLVSLSGDFLIILITSLLAGLAALFFLPQPISFVFAAGSFLALNVTFIMLLNRLKKYLTFDANLLLGPQVKNLASLLILIISFCFYLNINSEIKQNGFEVPDTLIETAIRFSQDPQTEVKGVKYIAQVPNLTSEQIEFLKNNPDLLRDQGIDPAIFENAAAQTNQKNSKKQTVSTAPSQDFVKNLVKSQLQSMLKPYENWIPLILALVIFITLHSLLSLLSIFLNPLLSLTFYVLEKSGFIKFTTEMREAKKLVV